MPASAKAFCQAAKEAESGREYVAIAGALRTVIVQKGKLPRGQWPKVAKETIDSLKDLHRWKNEKGNMKIN